MTAAVEILPSLLDDIMVVCDMVEGYSTRWNKR
jgi:hypothetical protein